VIASCITSLNQSERWPISKIDKPVSLKLRMAPDASSNTDCGKMEEVFNCVKTAVEKAISAEEKLKAFTLTKIKAVQKRANLCKLVNGELHENMRCMKHLHTQYDIRETELVKEILQFGVTNGEFTKLIKKELDILPSVMVSSLRGLERDMFIESKYTKLEPRMESIIAIMIRGLRNN